MQKDYDHKEIEPRISKIWKESGNFTPQIDSSKKPFSMFLVPPNASGGMHIGNVLMIAIQDMLARHYRAKGRPTLWIPGTDHGGYETQVTFERKLEKEGKSRFDFRRADFFNEIQKFVESNNSSIKSQIDAMGASVDWTRFRYTMDERALKSATDMFTKMVSDNLIYRRNYMVNYCSSCGTVLADIELNNKPQTQPLYFIKFPIANNEKEYIPIATARPEFIFTTTHILAHPADKRFAQHIGKILKNPITGDPVEVVESKRKFDPATAQPFLVPFAPSYLNYDYGYTLYNSIPSKNLLDWDGNMLERYPGIKPLDARKKEVNVLTNLGMIEKVDETYVGTTPLCKRGHVVESMIMLTWFLKTDDEKISLKKPALEALQKDMVTVLPRWKQKELTNYINKMHDWPIARQTVWGIRIPIWYDVSDPSKFIVWFFDKNGEKQYGNLKTFLDNGISLSEIESGIERIYAQDDASWTIKKEPNKQYLQETDTFDTWLSAGNWSVAAFGDLNSPDFNYFYPSEVMVLGHDLLQLSVARKIFLALYMTGKLPFKTVYLHHLVKGKDGKKMSKSLGNATTLEYYLDTYGADVTRMALISYAASADDFIFEDERLQHFQRYIQKLWRMAEFIPVADQYSPQFSQSLKLSSGDKYLLELFDRLSVSVGLNIEKYTPAQAQEIALDFITILDTYIQDMNDQADASISLSVFRHVYSNYLKLLHPFMPFITEELNLQYYKANSVLAS
ncbi:MAG: hypothetical protein RIT04_125 [Candidatus Parcubacteria bacterium]|jgi:valyl-tRNA synthetase